MTRLQSFSVVFAVMLAVFVSATSPIFASMGTTPSRVQAVRHASITPILECVVANSNKHRDQYEHANQYADALNQHASFGTIRMLPKTEQRTAPASLISGHSLACRSRF